MNLKEQRLEFINRIKYLRLEEIKKETKESKINHIVYIGKVDWKEVQHQEKILTKKDIYLMIEESLDEYNNPVIAEKYYTEDFKFVAGDRQGDQYQFLIPGKGFENQPKLIKQIEDLRKQYGREKDAINKERVEQEKIQKIATSIAKKEEEIQQIQEYQLKNPISQEDSKNGKKITGLNIKEETSLKQFIKGKTLENVLGLNKQPERFKGAKTLARVTTTSLNKNSDQKVTSQDAFVVICADGRVIPLDEEFLKPDPQLGNNPTQEILTTNLDGSVKRETITSSYLICNGNGREYLQTGYDEDPTHKELKYGVRSNELGQTINFELPTNVTYYRDSELQGFYNDRGDGNRLAKEAIQKTREHGEECENLDISDIDDDKNNDEKSHTHFQDNYIEYPDGKKITYKELAVRWGYYHDGAPDKVKAKEKIISEHEKKSNLSAKEIVEKIDDELEEQIMPNKR